MRFLYLFVSIIVFFGCSQKNSSAKFSKDEVESEVRVMLDNYFSDIAKDGLTAEFQYLDQSSEFFWVPPGYASALSYDSVRNILESRAPAYSSIHFKWKSLEVYPLDADHATYTGIVKGEMIDTARISTDVSLIESGVIIKRSDGWKLLCGQSAVLPK